MPFSLSDVDVAVPRPDNDRADGGSGRRRACAAGASMAAMAVAALVLAGPAAAWNKDATLKVMDTLPSLHPERLKVVTKTADAGTDEIFAAAKRNTPKWQTGPMIYDANGKLRYYRPMNGGDGTFDFRAQTYEGQPVITWFQGKLLRGFGEGQGMIFDQNYKQVAVVKAGNGKKMDLHEFKITPQGTALILAYQVQKGDTRSRRGGRKNGLIHDNFVQEVDIKTGKVLMEWDAGKDIKLTESYNTIPADKTIPFDYMHFNSVNLTQDGNIVVSGRATHAYYKIDRKTGKLIWRMGGRKSDFKMGKGARTRFQHDVHQVDATTWSAYDNNGDAPVKGLQSRGVLLTVNEKAMTVTLKKAFTHPKKILAVSQGNMQTLANGHEFIGWGGDAQNLTEFDAAGKVVFDARFLSPRVDSYRAYRGDWVGTPTGAPLVDAKTLSSGKVVVHMSWNGSTEVAAWRILAGPADGQLAPVTTVPFGDLETGATVTTTQPKFQVEALDAGGAVLAQSAVEDAHS